MYRLEQRSFEKGTVFAIYGAATQPSGLFD